MRLRNRKVPARSGPWSRRARPVTSGRRCLVVRIPDPARRRLSAPRFRLYRVALEGVRHLSSFLCHPLTTSYKQLCRIILRLRLAGLRSLFLRSIPKLNTPTVQRICRINTQPPRPSSPCDPSSPPSAVITCIYRHHSHLGTIHPPPRWSSQKSRTQLKWGQGSRPGGPAPRPVAKRHLHLGRTGVHSAKLPRHQCVGGEEVLCEGETPLPIACTRARLGSARLGSARLGSARLGSARLGSARLGSARLGSARLGSARLGSARLGSARLGSARRSSSTVHYFGSDSHGRLSTRDACDTSAGTGPGAGGAID